MPLGKFSYEVRNQLTDLREDLAAYRDRAESLADEGTPESRIIQAKIDGIGPPPEDGKSEPSAITDRRRQLNELQSTQIRPVMAWREMQFEAAALVRELDRRVAEIEDRERFKQARSPLDPRLWIEVFANLPKRTSALANALAGVNAIGLVASFSLLFLGPFLVSRVCRLVLARTAGKICGTVSGSKNVAPLILQEVLSGVTVLLVIALAIVAIESLLASLAGPHALESLGLSLLVAGLIPVVGQWLARSALLAPVAELRLVHFDDATAWKATRLAFGVSVVLTFETMLGVLERLAIVTVSFTNLSSSILVIAGSGLIFWLANLFRFALRSSDGTPGEASAKARPTVSFAAVVGGALQLFALAAFATAIAGYVMLARELFIGVVLSLAIIAIALVVQRQVAMFLHGLAEGPFYSNRRLLHLLPMVIGFALFIITLFLIALTWGYRFHEIRDAVNALRTGVDLGGARISAGDIFTFGLVFVIGYTLTRWTQQFLRVSILPEFGGGQGAHAALVTGVGYFGIMLAAVIAIASTGLDLSTLAFIAGALSVGLGFGLQSVVENFTSGIILLVTRPIKAGDWIEVGDFSGIVKKIAVNSTLIETWDKHYIIIPNSQLISGSVKNRSFGVGATRVIVPIGVAYGSDVNRVEEVLLDIAKDKDLILKFPEPFVRMAGFGDNSLEFKLFFFVADPATGPGAASEVNVSIVSRFSQEGIEIPFPQRDVHIRSAHGFAAMGAAEAVERKD